MQDSLNFRQFNMIENRETKEFEDDRKKWKIYFDIESSPRERGDSTILVSFLINRKESSYLTEKDIENLKQDLKDLGKFRIIKQGKDFLGE